MAHAKVHRQSVLMFVLAILTHILAAIFRIVLRIKQSNAQK